MILTWIALGILAGTAVAAIITYWNEIVDWAKETFNRLFIRGKLFLQRVGNEIKTWISGINKRGDAGTSTGDTRRATDEEIDALVEADVITWEEGERLKRGEKISLNL